MWHQVVDMNIKVTNASCLTLPAGWQGALRTAVDTNGRIGLSVVSLLGVSL